MPTTGSWGKTISIGGMVLVLVFLQGCGAKRHSVLAATGTTIGVEISQNPATQTPQGKLGYNRAELAFVPTGLDAEQGGNTAETADVVMELHYPGIFDMGPSSGIYQRLAVGNTAVQQPGAALLFARNTSGDVTAEAKAALAAVTTITETSQEIRASKASMARAYNRANAQTRKQFDQAAAQLGYADFKAFLKEANTSVKNLKKLRDLLEQAGLNTE